MSLVHELVNKNSELGSLSVDLELGKEYTYNMEKVILSRIAITYSVKEVGFWIFKTIIQEPRKFVVLATKDSKGEVNRAWMVDFDFFVNNLRESYKHQQLIKEELEELRKK